MLFGLGLLLNAIELNRPFAWSTFPVLGVLQRIAIVYVVVAWLTERTTLRTQILVAATVLLGYWAAMKLVPVPGAGPGVLTPEGNLASFIDRLVLGRHMWHPPWEAEGLLSTAPAVVTALFGVFAGGWLADAESRRHRSALLWSAGAAATLVGLLWGRVFPINKNLWTSSFVLFSAGMGAQALAICHWSLERQRWRGWSTPFVAFGRNPLFAYFCSVVLDNILTRWRIRRDRPEMAHLLAAHQVVGGAVLRRGERLALLRPRLRGVLGGDRLDHAPPARVHRDLARYTARNENLVPAV